MAEAPDSKILSTIQEIREDRFLLFSSDDSSIEDECFLNHYDLTPTSNRMPITELLEPPATEPMEEQKVPLSAIPQTTTHENEANGATNKGAVPKKKATMQGAFKPKPSSTSSRSAPKYNHVHQENAVHYKSATLKSHIGSNRRGTAAAAAEEKFVTCYRCNVGFKGFNAEKNMDNHLKECGQILCELCDKKFKSVQTLQIHQRKSHMKPAEH